MSLNLTVKLHRISKVVRCIDARTQFTSKRSSTRAFSATSGTKDDLVLTKVDEESCVATLTMNRPPVNSLSLELFQAISTSLKELEERNSKVQSLVLASSLTSVFSAGLDIMEMHQPDPARLAKFWKSFQQLYLDLYGSRLACIAAIEGHAPAAGCMLTMSCDYRIMANSETSKGATTGLNESKLGIVAPPWLGELMINTIGHREAEKALALGILYSPEEALRIGLVDEVVPKEDVMKMAQDEAVRWSKIPPQARVASKLLARKKYLDHLIDTRQEDLDNFCSFVQTDSVQRKLTMYIQQLKKKAG